MLITLRVMIQPRILEHLILDLFLFNARFGNDIGRLLGHFSRVTLRRVKIRLSCLCLFPGSVRSLEGLQKLRALAPPFHPILRVSWTANSAFLSASSAATSACVARS